MDEVDRYLVKRLREAWKDKHAVWDAEIDWLDLVTEDGGEGYTYFHLRGMEHPGVPREHLPRVIYTTQRMFDGKFWSAVFVYKRTKHQYVLRRDSVKYHAKRKDAKARAIALLYSARDELVARAEALDRRLA